MKMTTPHLLLLLLILCPAAAAMLSSSQSSAVATMLAPLASIPSTRIDDSAGSGSSGALNRTELPIDLLEKYSAYCLDGTPFSYYFRPAATAAAANKWVVWLQGGGLCVEKMDCLHRARSSYGSSSTWADQIEHSDNVLSGDAANPFADYNHVFMRCT